VNRSLPALPSADWIRALSAFQYALIASFLIHVFLIFGVGIRLPDFSRIDNLPAQLEVVLVNSKSSKRPTHADALAQNNLEGGGNVDEDRRASSPLPVMNHQKTDLSLQEKRVAELERETQRLLTQAKSPTTVPTLETKTAQNPDRSVPDAADLMSRSLEIARLEAQIDKNLDTYNKRPRRKFVGASTQEFRFARYIEDWRQKVERVGTLNYPEAARDQKIYGSLQLTVSIRADGSVEKVEINRSSGQKILDEAAIRIVNLAAPYAPLPSDIVRDTDILGITRTWTFTRDDQLSTSQ
jgi:protein TonB